ncbi:MAG: phage portal protein [Firmicutes bacterium]|nr:phage portal protein [Bacillota bacterium]
MAKNKSKKITLDDLITRKTQGKLDKMQVKYYDSKELGGKIEIRKIKLKEYMKLADGIDEDNAVDGLEFMNELVFKCCPLFNQNSKELVKTYEVAEAIELPSAVLNDNMGEMQDIVEIINSFYGLDKVDKDIKN